MLVVVAGMALVFSVLAALVFRTEHELIESQLVHNYRETTKSFAAIISHSIREKDFEMLEEMLGQKAREENIRFVLVRNPAKDVIARAGQWKDQEIPPHPEGDEEHVPTMPGGAWEVRAPHSLLHAEGHVFEVDEKIPGLETAGSWTVHIGVDTAHANQEVIANTRRIVLLSGLVLVASLATMLFIDRRLRRIFQELITVTRRMAGGDRSLRVNIQTGDELQTLGESFNAMANALKEKEDQVRVYAETLEARVRERTHALVAEKQKLGAILGAIRGGLVLYGPGPKAMWANNIARGWLLGPNALPPNMQRQLFHDGDGVEAIARRALQDGAALEAEKDVDDPSGSTRSFQISAAPITGEGGGGLKVLLLLLDVSEKRHLERRLLHAGKMVAIGELAGGVAHEINTPVGVITAKAEFLLERLGGRVSPKDVEDLEKILKNAHRIAAITRGLVSFSRESGARREDVAINELVEEAIELLAERIREAGVEVETSFASSIPFIRANPDEVQQVLLNLLTNALDAMNGQEGRRNVLRVSTEIEGDRVAVHFTDSGCGIPANLEERIFEPFFSTKGVGKGTGLGLAISLGIVKAHGGRIAVKSRVNNGSTFTVELPLRAEALVSSGGSKPA